MSEAGEGDQLDRVNGRRLHLHILQIVPSHGCHQGFHHVGVLVVRVLGMEMGWDTNTARRPNWEARHCGVKEDWSANLASSFWSARRSSVVDG